MSLVLGKNPSNELKEIELTNSGNLKVDLAGSSGGALSVNADITGNTIGLATESTVGTLATESTLSSVQTNVATLAGAVSGTEFQVDVITSALPSGAATSALQTTGNTSLSAIETDTGTIAGDTTSLDGKITQGYDAQIASGGNGAQQVLVYARDSGGNLDALSVNASGELKVASTATAASTTNVNESVAGSASGTANSTAVDMDGSSQLTIFGTSTNTSDAIVVQVSHNNSTWVEHTEYFVNFSATGGNYAVNISNTGARYWRVSQTDTLASAFTLVVNSSKK